MNAYKVTNLKIDPDTLAVLMARARRARAEAVRSLVLKLVHKLAPSFDLRLGRMHWG